jgi:hypothetical protein
MLTHHTPKNKGKQAMVLGEGKQPKLSPLTETGSGSVQEKEKARLTEIISKVNDLFDGELTEDYKLVYVNNVIKGKTAGVRGPGPAGEQQHQGAVRELAGPGQRNHERHHRRVRRPLHDEQTGWILRRCAVA